MNEDKLKEEFINSFGEEKWNQEEVLSKLIEPQMELAKYLGVDMIPVICEDIDEDSRYYFNDDYIVISPLMLETYINSLKSLVHEMRHQYQYKCLKDQTIKENPELVESWKEELSVERKPLDQTNQESVDEYYSLMVELDAYAFTKWYLKNKYDIYITHPNIIYDEIISQYIKKYFN